MTTKTIDAWGTAPISIKLSEKFEDIVARNPLLRIEQTANGEVVLMSPTGGESGYRNSKIISQLDRWAETYGGRVFDSSTLFELPSGAKRSPDAAWICADRWNALSKEQRKSYPPICPDFVVELRSETDRLIDLEEKMEEYLENGIQQGWLIDPLLKQVHIYRPDAPKAILSEPATLTAGNAMPGFVLDCKVLWEDA